jgi:hypothetical protein
MKGGWDAYHAASDKLCGFRPAQLLVPYLAYSVIEWANRYAM